MLHITYTDYEALRAHGEETYPNECCGVLLGKSEADGNYVRQIVRAGNTRTDSAHNRYNMPAGLVKIQRQARSLSLDIVASTLPPRPQPNEQTSRGPLDRLLLRHHRREGQEAAVTNSFLLSGTTEETKFIDQPT
jgi:proteasome lid subunit RPN8/RPN11